LLFPDNAWFWERLAANVGIVLLFGAFYFRFPGSPWVVMTTPETTRAAITRDREAP